MIRYFPAQTTASTYPTTSGALQTSNLDTTYGSGFVTKLTSTGSAITWSTYLGSNSTQSMVRGLAVDTSGNVYATGGAVYESTLGHSFAFPVTSGTVQTSTSGAAEE